MSRPRLELRAAASELAIALLDAGFEAFFAGGCVRDRLCGITPRDYDIATNATPEQLRVLFPKARGVGESFGVMLVRHAGHTLEVSTFREDGEYRDGRRPIEVRFCDAESDARRRDFTINGIFEHPRTGEIVDFVGGRADLDAKVVRAIGVPDERIREDRLRMLRAPRFAARFEFAIDDATAEAIRTHAGELLSVSAERVGEEIRRMMSDHHRLRAAQLIEDLGLDRVLFTAPSPTHAWIRLTSLAPTATPPTALAAWWLDRIGSTSAVPPRPSSDEQAAIVDSLRRALMLSNDETAAIHALLSQRELLLGPFEKFSLARRVRASSRPGFDEALSLLAGESPDAFRALNGQADAENPHRALPMPHLNGAMLLADGMAAGPQFKVILDHTLDAQIEGRVSSPEAALEFARQLFRGL